jgi:hypothetical protein
MDNIIYLRTHWPFHVCQCIILITNIFNCVLVKIIEIWYFENINRNKLNILYDNIYILLEKYGQNDIYIVHLVKIVLVKCNRGSIWNY